MPTVTTYSFDKATQFLNGLSEAGLHAEIGHDERITIQVVGVSTNEKPGGHDVLVEFLDDLEAQDPDQLPYLEEVVAAHVEANHKPVEEPKTVKVQEEKPGEETGGNYGAETIAWDAAPGVSSKDVTLLLPIAILTAALETKGLNDGDEVGLEIGPETVVGALGADAAASSTTIPLPATMKAAWVAGAIWAGLVVELDDGANKDCLGILLSVDTAADTFEVSVPTANAFAAATPTLVKVNATMSPGILGAGTDCKGWVEVKAGGLEEFGNAKIGGTRIDAGKVIRCRYHNTSDESVRVVIRLEYLY